MTDKDPTPAPNNLTMSVMQYKHSIWHPSWVHPCTALQTPHHTAVSFATGLQNLQQPQLDKETFRLSILLAGQKAA